MLCVPEGDAATMLRACQEKQERKRNMKPIKIYQKAVGVDAAPLPLPVAVPIRPGKSVIIPFRPKEPEPSEENVKREKLQTKARSAVKKKKYEVASVEISYNGDDGKFNQFLAAVMREYLTFDPSSPDADDAADSEVNDK